MEIDGDKINLSDNSESPRIFQISYAGERLNNNPKFQKWKTEMFKIYGDDAKFFKCLIDNIIFSTPFDEYKNFPFYLCNCPICQTPTCYFCSKYCEDSYRNGNCCFKRRIRCMLFQDGVKFIKPDENTRRYDFSGALAYFYLPVLNFLFLIFFFHLSFYFGMIRKDAENKKNRSHNEIYECYLREHNIFEIISAINIAFGILLTVPFIFPYYCFVIVFTIISFPFKLYPVFYYMGVAFGGK